MQLGWAEFLPDDRDALTAAYRRSFRLRRCGVSCGGIGGTPDDHTRQAAAAALDPAALHPEAEEAIALRTAEMAATSWPGLEWTLDTRYRAMQHQRSHVEHSFLVFRMPESRITPAMQAVESRWPGVGVQPAQRGRGWRRAAYRPGREGRTRGRRASLGFP